MYEDNEVAISNRYLKEVISTIDEPIVILGGWAVYFLVNDAYGEATGRDYIGSRDIDLGFSMAAGDIANSVLALALMKLEDELGFEHQAFRLFKETHAETGESLKPEEARNLLGFQRFPMYVDLIVDKIPENFREQFGFTPIDEPLLGLVFADSANRTEMEGFGKQLWLPSPNMMLAMKIKSHPDRQKDHKRAKDVADISALLLFGSVKREEGWLTDILSDADITRFKDALTPGDIEMAAQAIGIEQALIENALSQIK